MKSNMINKMLQVYTRSTGHDIDTLDINESIALDSIQRLMFASALEEEFKINLDLERINENTTFAELLEFLEK